MVIVATAVLILLALITAIAILDMNCYLIGILVKVMSMSVWITTYICMYPKWSALVWYNIDRYMYTTGVDVIFVWNPITYIRKTINFEILRKDSVQLNLNFTHACRYTHVLVCLMSAKLQKLVCACTVACDFSMCAWDRKHMWHTRGAHHKLSLGLPHFMCGVTTGIVAVGNEIQLLCSWLSSLYAVISIAWKPYWRRGMVIPNILGYSHVISTYIRLSIVQRISVSLKSN